MPPQTNEALTLSESKKTSLIDPSFLFRFELAVRKNACKWTDKGLKLALCFGRVPLVHVGVHKAAQ